MASSINFCSLTGGLPNQNRQLYFYRPDDRFRCVNGEVRVITQFTDDVFQSIVTTMTPPNLNLATPGGRSSSSWATEFRPD